MRGGGSPSDDLEPTPITWASFDDLTPEEQNALISQPAEWGSEWGPMIGTSGSTVTYKTRSIYGWNATQSWFSMVYDYSNNSDEIIALMKESDPENWNGKIKTTKTVSDNPSGISNIASLIKDSEISSDRKILRYTNGDGEYIHYYRLS